MVGSDEATSDGSLHTSVCRLPRNSHLSKEEIDGDTAEEVQLGRTPPATYGEIRPVGRAELPATVLGLIVHAAEHTSRHTGQFITTLKIARGLRAAPAP